MKLKAPKLVYQLMFTQAERVTGFWGLGLRAEGSGCMGSTIRALIIRIGFWGFLTIIIVLL